MNEKAYKAMNFAGVSNIVIGVVVAVAVSYTHLTLPTT